MLRFARFTFALLAVVPVGVSTQVVPAASDIPPPHTLPIGSSAMSSDTPRQGPPPPGVLRPGTPGDPQTVPTPRAAPQPQPTPAPPPPRRSRGRDVNVQVEITIGDQLATAAPDKRVVSMLIADGALGRIRSSVGGGMVVTNIEPGAVLNIDARPDVLEGDRISIELTIEYRPASNDSGKRLAQLHEMLTVILQNGKPQLVSQAADPVTDRKMTVEVRASVIK